MNHSALFRFEVLIDVILQEKAHLEQCQPLYINVMSVSLKKTFLFSSVLVILMATIAGCPKTWFIFSHRGAGP
jgi:hypothetical protein